MSDVFAGAYSPAEVREFDRIAIEERGIPAYELMCRAGAAVVAAASARHPDARRWLVICGAGNNAGDGYVVARLAAAAGRQVVLATVEEPSALAGAAGIAQREWMESGGAAVRFEAPLLAVADLVIDAMLGTGLARPLAGAWLEAVRAVNAADLPVVAVDVPSGLDAASGVPLGDAVRADCTVTFIALKHGLFLGEGAERAGEVQLATLDVPPEVLAGAAPRFRRFADTQWRALLPRRARAAHKGDFGHVLVVGGNHGMAGAARLCAEAALRSGAGLVSVATRSAHATQIATSRPELMCRGVEGSADIDPLLQRATVVAVGPGLGQDTWAAQLLARVLATDLPMVVDADALNLLAQVPARRSNWVLTPHPGEAGRLLGVSTRAIQSDRLAAHASLVARFGGSVLLKGRGTLVGDGTEPPWLVDAGNPGMATGGMGDVLTGIIAAFLAQMPAVAQASAAACAGFVHASAADDVARSGGERGLVASDLFDVLRAWVNP